MNQNKPSNNKNASALIAVIITVAILSLLAGAFVSTVNNKRMTLSQGSTWQEALVAAEAGAHQGIAQVEQGLFQNSLPATAASPAPADPPNLTLSHSGEGSTTVTAKYSLTRIYTSLTPSGPKQPFYRVVSTGTVGLPGSKSLSMDSRDAVLRKLNLRGTDDDDNLRTATRTVEAWLQPTYVNGGSSGLRTDQAIDLNNHNIFIDSFDSTLLTRSYGGVLPGQPYPAGNSNQDMGYYNKAPYNFLAANVSTNVDTMSGGDAYIYGDLKTNGGTSETVVGLDNLQGTFYDDYYEPMPPVYAPTWNVSSQGPINKSKTLTGGTAASHAQYIVSSISLSGQKTLTFDFGKTGANPDPNKKYVDIYVTGDVSTKGAGSQTDGSIVIVNGVTVTMYVGGNMNMGGNGLVNNNNNAISLSIYGITPPDGISQTFSLGGSATFYGTVYAPGAALVLNGGGNGGEFVGSLAGKTATLKGNVQIRYDESLAITGQSILTSFKIAAWFEDSSGNDLLQGL